MVTISDLRMMCCNTSRCRISRFSIFLRERGFSRELFGRFYSPGRRVLHSGGRLSIMLMPTLAASRLSGWLRVRRIMQSYAIVPDYRLTNLFRRDRILALFYLPVEHNRTCLGL